VNYNLFIDDQIDDIDTNTGKAIRDPKIIDPCREYVGVKTVEEAISHIIKNGCPIFISFDHDLGLDSSGKPLETTELAKWLVEKDLDESGKFLPEGFSYQVHSANVYAENNLGILDRYMKFKQGA